MQKGSSPLFQNYFTLRGAYFVCALLKNNQQRTSFPKLTSLYPLTQNSTENTFSLKFSSLTKSLVIVVWKPVRWKNKPVTIKFTILLF